MSVESKSDQSRAFNADVQILVLAGRSESFVSKTKLFKKLADLGQAAPMAILCGNVGGRIAEALVNLGHVSTALGHHSTISTILHKIGCLGRGLLGTLSIPASAIVWEKMYEK